MAATQTFFGEGERPNRGRRGGPLKTADLADYPRTPELASRTTRVIPSSRPSSEGAPAALPLPPTTPRCAWVGLRPLASYRHQRSYGHNLDSRCCPRGYIHRWDSIVHHNEDTPTLLRSTATLVRIHTSGPSTSSYASACASCVQKSRATGNPTARKKTTGQRLPRGVIRKPVAKALRAARRGADAPYTYYYRNKDLIDSWHQRVPFN